MDVRSVQHVRHVLANPNGDRHDGPHGVAQYQCDGVRCVRHDEGSDQYGVECVQCVPHVRRDEDNEPLRN